MSRPGQVKSKPVPHLTGVPQVSPPARPALLCPGCGNPLPSWGHCLTCKARALWSRFLARQNSGPTPSTGRRDPVSKIGLGPSTTLPSLGLKQPWARGERARGRPRVELTARELAWLKARRARRDESLRELARQFEHSWGKSISPATLCRYLKGER